VAILSENRPEWAIADFACLTGRFIDVAIYPTVQPATVEYVLRDSGAVAIFVSTRELANKVAAIRERLPLLRHIISFDAVDGSAAEFDIADLERRGADSKTPDSALRHRENAMLAQPDDVAMLIYTSGTTGEPKGVMLTHANLRSNIAAARQVVDVDRNDVVLSIIPLSHIFERMAGHYLMFEAGASIAYAESAETIAANMVEVRPTLMVAVPRLYEKIYARILENALSGGSAKRHIFVWARRVGERWADARLAGQHPSVGLGIQYRVAQRLVFSKLQARTGGRLRYFVSGGAPLAPEINKFFYAAGLVILEGYGLTETSPVIAVNTPRTFRIGTVGVPVTGVAVRIADDGEILTRGPHVMLGYFNKPHATAEVIDAEGWFHTGDIGEMQDGFLTITDRKKDLIVTAGGKNIAPQPIENRVRQGRYVSEALLVGDRRPFPIVLVVPDFEQLGRWARREGLAWNSHEDLIELPAARSKMDREVLEPLSDLARFETPKIVVLLSQGFSLDRGELTPTLKVKRRAVEERYKALIDAAYADAKRSHATRA
jgi:long-chain acyl-CoA synthetase